MVLFQMFEYNDLTLIKLSILFFRSKSKDRGGKGGRGKRKTSSGSDQTDGKGKVCRVLIVICCYSQEKNYVRKSCGTVQRISVE